MPGHRSKKKGPFVNIKLLKKARALRDSGAKGNKLVIKTRERRSMVVPDFVGITMMIHNGKTYIPVLIVENMIGHKLGEFALTRTFSGHAADKKSR